MKQFEELVNKGSLSGMAAFLQQLPKTEVLAVRAKAKLLRTISWWRNDASHERFSLAGLAT